MHPTLEDGTEGPYDLTLDDMIAELTALRQQHGNLPVTIYWDTSRYSMCHWKGQVSYIYHEHMTEEVGFKIPLKQVLLSVY